MGAYRDRDRIEVLVGAYPRREGLCGSDGWFTSAGRLPRRTAVAIIHGAKVFATSFYLNLNDFVGLCSEIGRLEAYSGFCFGKKRAVTNG